MILALLGAPIVGVLGSGAGAAGNHVEKSGRMSTYAQRPLGHPGSVPVGAAKYPVPSGALFVSSAAGSDRGRGTAADPLRTIAEALTKATPGATIVLRGGVYHESLFIAADKRVTIQNYPGEAVWLDGSVPVTNWTRHGSTWVSSGWTAQFDDSESFTKGSDAGGFVNPDYPMAAHPDQVFVGVRQLAQVAARVTPGAGQFAVDYRAQTITIGTDPQGKDVRASDLSQAFVVAGRLTLRGIGVRRYATSLPEIATIYFGGDIGGDRLENVVVRRNATEGVSLSAKNCSVNHITSSFNGMTGLQGYHADGSVVENSLMRGNDTQHFNPAPASAGMKIASTSGLTIRSNYVTGNQGINGIWTDVTVTHFAIVGNTVTDNRGRYGIITELSDTGIVANNFVSGVMYGYTAFDTGNVKVFNNAFGNDSVWDIGLSQDERRNSDPTTSRNAPWVVRNIIAANNRFATAGSFQFYALDKRTNTPVSSMNVTVNGNLFPVPANAHQPVMVGWGGSNNVRVTYYRTPAQLDTGLKKTWTNAQKTEPVSTADSSYAVPLPSDVAKAIGVPAGTKHVGTF